MNANRVPTLMKYALLLLLASSLSLAAQTEKPSPQNDNPSLRNESPSVQTEKPSPVDFRHHFRIIDRDKATLYEVTTVTRFSEEKDENYVLVRDEGHGDFVFRKVWTFENQLSLSRLSDIKDRSFIQASFTFPATSKTRSATLAEGRRNPLLMDIPVIFTLETNGAKWEGLDKDWSEPARLRQLRHQVRQTTDFSLVEAMERMRGTLFATDTASYFFLTVCKYAVYGTSQDDTAEDQDTSAHGTKVVDMAPDCDFDKQFGFPCSAKQLERVKKAAAAQKILTRY